MPMAKEKSEIEFNQGGTGGRHIQGPGLLWWIGPLSFALMVFYLSRIWLNLDVAWLLYCAERVWDGAKLYVDIYEINPPLAVYINLPAVWASRLLGWPEIPVFYAYVILLLGLSLWLCRSLINVVFQTNSQVTRYGIWLSLVVITCNGSLDIFGQREHFVFFLTVPYILGAAARAQGKILDRRVAIVIGCLAGLGMAFKPYFLLLWVMVEAYLAWRQKATGVWGRPENLAIAAVIAVYSGAVLIFEFQYLKLVLIIRQVYLDFDTSYRSLLLNKVTLLWFLGSLTLVSKRNEPIVTVMRILFISSTAFLLTAFIQKKGWPNHLYPAVATSLWLLCVALISKVEVIDQRRKLTIMSFRGVVWATILVLMALFIVKAEKYYRYQQSSPLVQLLPLVQEQARGKPIYIFSTNVKPAFPLVNYAGANWPYRLHSLWPLPGIYKAKKAGLLPPKQISTLEYWLTDTVVTDLVRTPPKLLIVDRNRFRIGLGNEIFDFLGYFGRDPRLQKLLATYVFLTEIDGFAIYRRARKINAHFR
jgi:hypothetical protein